MSFSFKTWPFPSSEKTTHLLMCSKYGLIAHATNNNLSIYVEEYGHSTPLIMWCPFEHNITALGWYDASMTICNTVPVLVLSSESGKLEVFDCRSRRSIFICRVNTNFQPVSDMIYSFQFPTPTTIPLNVANSRREFDYVTSIKWSQFSSSHFFVGTKNGRLIHFEISIGQIVRCRIIWELFFDFEIDYISIEPQFGEICAVASKSGSVATINNINQFKEGKAPEASPYVVTLSNKTDSIHEIKFYPTSTEFLILVTTSNSLLYSISKNCTAPLLMLPGIIKFHNIHSPKNIALIVRDNSVELWAFLPNQSKRLSEAKLSSASKIAAQKEILVSDMMGDKLIMITAQMWLTTVEVRDTSKLFVTRRVKLLDAKPMAFSYANESIAIVTSIGHVLITETSNQNFIAQMTYKNQNTVQQAHQNDVQNQPIIQNEQIKQNEQDKQNEKADLNGQIKQNEQVQQTEQVNINKQIKQNEEVQQTDQVHQNEEVQRDDQNKQTQEIQQSSQEHIPKMQNVNKVNKQVTFLEDNTQNQSNTELSQVNKRALPSFNSLNNKTENHISLGESISAPNLSLGETENSSMQSFIHSIKQSKRTRMSIFNSCASSSSLLIQPFEENAQQNEEILDKSIVVSNDGNNNNDLNFPNSRAPIATQPFQTPISPLLGANLNRKRRVSAATADILKNKSVISHVMSEGLKETAKEATPPSNPILTSSLSSRHTNMPSIPSIPSNSKEGQTAIQRQQQQPIQLKPQGNIPIASRRSSGSLLKFSGINTNLSQNEAQKNRMQQVSTKVMSKYKFGNNCSIMWNYQIAKNTKIDHIEWIASTRAIAYTLSKRVTEKDLTEKGSKDEIDLENNAETNQNKLHLLPKYSGPSFIYLIDFKFHRISRLFDKPGISISDVTFSANKQYFFITINGFMVELFHNKLKPKKIHSFTFETDVFVAFIAYYLIFVDSNGVVYRNRFELGREFELKMEKSHVKMKKEYGQITCVIGRKSSIFMGTTTGYVLSVDSNSFHIVEVLQMKSSIISIKTGPLDSTLIEDSKGVLYTITAEGESATLPQGTKTAILASPNTLLIRKKDRSFIEVYQTNGSFVPSYPHVAIRCPMMMPPNRWIRSLLNEDPIDQNTLIDYGLSYVASLVDAKQSPKFTYEQVLHLRNLIMDTPQLWKTAYKLSLFLRDFEAAQTIIVTFSSPTENDQNWAINMMKCASFIDDSIENDKIKDKRLDGILFAGTNLIKNNFISDGVDILITAGLWVDAVKMLLRLGMIKEAAKITRIYCNKNTLDVLNEVTKMMFKKTNLIYYALSMLCEMGLENQAIKELENLNQFDAVKAFKKVIAEIDKEKSFSNM